MPRPGERLLVCPDCDKQGVRLKLRPYNEDHYACRYCDWYAFAGGHDPQDVTGRSALSEANPGLDL
jgi:hypothetical protein